jgi:hypothetical protein
MFSIYCKECGEEIAKTEVEEVAKATKDTIRCLDCEELTPVVEEEEEEEELDDESEEEEKES